MPQLTDVKGVGAKTAEKLVERGIDTVEKLAFTRPEELKEILGISLLSAKEICNSAKSIALDTALQPMTLEEIIQRKKMVTKRIPTGSLALDNLLKGGIPTEAITGLCGEYGSGKTQMCLQLAVNTIKQGRKVAWIETESGTFSPDRLLEIAQGSGVKINLKEDMPFIIRAIQVPNPYTLFLAYEKLDSFVSSNNIDLGLLVIDSFTAKFRTAYSGREVLPLRSAEESRHFGYLDLLASKYNCAVVITGQIMDVPDAGQQLRAMVKTGTRKELYGGNVFKHSVTHLLMLQKIKAEGEYECIVADSSEIVGKAVFRILSVGVRDVATR